jgi:hypothetical protein
VIPEKSIHEQIIIIVISYVPGHRICTCIDQSLDCGGVAPLAGADEGDREVSVEFEAGVGMMLQPRFDHKVVTKSSRDVQTIGSN